MEFCRDGQRKREREMLTLRNHLAEFKSVGPICVLLLIKSKKLNTINDLNS